MNKVMLRLSMGSGPRALLGKSLRGESAWAIDDRRCCALCPMDPLRRSPSPCSSRASSPRTPPCEMFGFVGIEAVLDQLKIKAMKMGFEFNIMVVGQSGLGKSTMVNTLFKSKMWKSTPPGLGQGPMPQTLQLHSVTHVIEEKGLKLKLTVTDTPGFGDQINNDKCWDPILGYINEQYEQYLQEEILITRQRYIPDTRVHCCIYFVPPTGHCLRPLDIEFLQRLCRTVNVVPVIARADSLTIEERENFRRRIQHNLKTHCIDVYPQKCFDEDISDKILNSKIRDRIPFAVVGADREHLVNGKCVLGRKTKWGIIEVENMAHCEFALLRDLLIRSHLQDLKDITHNVHYENYRVCRLNKSHMLPRGPGWVNLAPAPPSTPATPGPSKARQKVHNNFTEEW
ncbi:septin-12 [Phyllostomus hastatus]|uniref:septin-12 n=1 Tax=Phyllostomus hastatus TaxID=9423 RepID=UPI001E682F05|nr:septin-12 [Phyllostomus hastatus]